MVETWQIILLSVIATLVLALLGFAIKASLWAGEVNSDRKWFKKSIEEIRDDIKRIFETLAKRPSGMVESGSKLRLSDFGQKVADAIGAEEWARKECKNPEVIAGVSGKLEYDVQTFCQYWCLLWEPEGADAERLKKYAFENGIDLDDIKRVLAIKLRDRILLTRHGTEILDVIETENNA